MMLSVILQMFISLLSLVMLMSMVKSLTINNEIVGNPDIDCLDDHIKIFFTTREFFAGRIYAKGTAENPDCYKDNFAALRTKKPHLVLMAGTCGMGSLRSLNPRGMYYSVTLVVSFHSIFITHLDQAFHVKCFFEESSEGLSAGIGISAIPTAEFEVRHSKPGCVYTIHSSSIEDIKSGMPAGDPIRFARIGDRILHQWHCNDQMYGILINNCYVSDGAEKRAEVVDVKGCILDPILLTPIHYSSDLQRAYAESRVFKFADRPGLWFFCEVQTCLKRSEMCENLSPPLCTEKSVIDEESYVQAASTLHKTAVASDYKTDEYVDEYIHEEPFDFKSVRTVSHSSIPSKLSMHSTNKPVLHRWKMEKSLASRRLFTTTQIATVLEAEEEFKHKGRIDFQRYTSTILPTMIRKDIYVHHDDVTFPTSLNELLASLPENIDAHSLQTLLTESEKNRQKLLENVDFLLHQGKFKRVLRQLDTDQIASRESGKTAYAYENAYETIHSSTSANKIFASNASPVMGNQLFIYDIDEEPPKSALRHAKEAAQPEIKNCITNREALYMFVLSAGGLAILFTFLVALIAYTRFSTVSLTCG